jgi:hypothetical protein
MKHTLLATALLSVLSTAVYSDTTPTKPIPAEQPSAAPTLPSAASPSTKTTTATPALTNATTTPPPTPTINCEYHIPATTTTIDPSLITTWATQATVQSFEFNPATIDQELIALKLCFTDQGWKGFDDALQKSGNINSIKSQQLTVNSQVNGNVTINPVKDNQWKLTLPLQVVYQNGKDKLTQQLSVDVLIGRKLSGDLGIMQMIAAPEATSNHQPQSTAIPATKSTATPTTSTEPSTAPTTTTTPQPAQSTSSP